VGRKFFDEQGQKEVYYLLGRTLALARPELAFSQRLAPDKIEALLQAALSMARPIQPTVDPRVFDEARRLLEKNLSEPARAALSKVIKASPPNVTPTDIRTWLEGVELTAARAGLFAAGEMEPVQRMVSGETGSASRVTSAAKLRDLLVFATSEDLHELRVAVGTHLEVQVRK
jgi:hypothetical protein